MKNYQSILMKWQIYVIGMIAVLLASMVFMTTPVRSEEPDDFSDEDLSKIELLGKYVFFDKISDPERMACVTCHDPETGGTGSVSGVNLHDVAITGANPHTIGNLKPPTNAYANLIAPFHECNSGGLGGNNHCGGNFWNGRADGNETALYPNGATKHIGNEIFFETDGTPLDGDVADYAAFFGPTSDQALNPMPNPVEQNISRQGVCEHVASAKYAELYEEVWGVSIDCSDEVVTVQAGDLDPTDESDDEKAFDISFKRLMLAVGAWQGSLDVNSFSSKRDKALKRELDGIDVDDTPGEFPLVGLTDEENYGHDLFYATRFAPMEVTIINDDGEEEVVEKFSNCAFCHSDNPLTPGPGPKDTGAELFQLYSADDYHNIGTPPNVEIPGMYDENGELIDEDQDPDMGIAGHVDGLPRGFFKTPTVRNVDKRKGNGFTKAYTHNGWFKSLESLVHFYNTANVNGATAADYGITRCPDGVDTEKEALANNCWPAPAYSQPSALPFLVGDLHLTPEDEAALVAYMKTLTDEHSAKAPKPYKPSKKK